MNYDGSNKKEIASENGGASSFSSSPDGTKLVYHRLFTGIIILDNDGEKTTIMNDELIPWGAGITWAEDGKIYFSRYKNIVNDHPGGQYIYSMDDDGSNVSQITPDFFNQEVETPLDDMPSVSPDNSSIVFTTQRSGNFGVIAKMDLSNNNIAYLTWPDGPTTGVIMGVYAADEPSFSPDGNKIVFSGYIDSILPEAEQDHAQIFVMNSDGSGKTSLTHNTIGNCLSPSWSPDGNLIVFEKDSLGYARICVINADGSNEKIICENGVLPCFIGQPK